MKKILLLAVLSITIIVVVFSTLNTNAQSLPIGQAGSPAVPAMHKNIDITGIGNSHGTLLPYENTGFGNILPESVKSGLDINSLIPIMDSIYAWEFDSLAGLWYLYPYQRMVDVVYDASNNLISFVSENFNGAVWVKNINYVNTYDVNNNVLTSLAQSWSGSAWENNYQDIYTYDAYNNMTQDLSQNWSGTAWVNSNQNLYTYDADNNEIENISQNWSGTAWTNTSLYSYTYNAQSYLTSEEDLAWTGSAWINSTRSDYTYDANNNVTSILNGSWNGISWSQTGVITLTYDGSNHKTTELDQSWNGSAWELEAQITFLYDSHYNLTSAMMQRWGSSSWINAFKESFTYDANDFIKTLAIKQWNNTGAYVNGGDSLYYYFHTVVGLHDITASLNDISIYPNPATNEINIISLQKSTIEISNSNGQIIKTVNHDSGETSIDIEDLSSGVYFVRLKSDKEIVTKRIIKE
jgi:hypothetical protein